MNFETILGRLNPRYVARSHIGRRVVETRELGYETTVTERGEVLHRRRYLLEEQALAGHREVCDRLLDGDTRFLRRPQVGTTLWTRVRGWLRVR